MEHVSGWYPDPMGAAGLLRYYDGVQWTQHVHQQQSGPQHVWSGGGGGGAAASTVVVTRSGPNHVLHLILTILTLGLWLPVWILIAISVNGKTVVTTTAAAGGGAGGGGYVPAPQPYPVQQQPPHVQPAPYQQPPLPPQRHHLPAPETGSVPSMPLSAPPSQLTPPNSGFQSRT